MKNFMVTYHMSNELLEASANSTPEEKAEGMKQWMEWAKNTGTALVDFGQPLGGGLVVNSDGSSTPSSREVCGYSMIQAEDIESAVKILQKHPHTSWNDSCSIEVHEAMKMPNS
ncbi:hypothetical protein OAQ99_05555 [Candidatus Kapabacteria bacterium]|nr:hypothetical protein [Candidatus Kapabacteria bacterium]